MMPAGADTNHTMSLRQSWFRVFDGLSAEEQSVVQEKHVSIDAAISKKMQNDDLGLYDYPVLHLISELT